MAIFAPFVAPYDPIATSWSMVRKAPSSAHWFGTDELGRDILSRIIFGTRASLLAGVISVSIAIAIGVPLGLLAGYRGGFIDALISRITDAMLACPALILAIALAAFLGPSLTNAMIAIGITATPIFIRLTRGQAINVKVENYIEAAEAIGNSSLRIAMRHVLPNIIPALLVQITLSIAASHHRRSRALIPRPGPAAAVAVLGQHAELRTTLPRQRALDGVLAGAVDLPDRDVVQLARRRLARRARSKGAVTQAAPRPAVVAPRDPLCRTHRLEEPIDLHTQAAALRRQLLRR